MPLRFTLLIAFLATIGLNFCQAQIKIHFPVERAVFQRDLNNQGTIYISGSIDKAVDKIEARLMEYKGKELVDFTDWQEMENNSRIGGFKGELKVKGGWYKLIVRSWSNGKELNSTILNKVGVGEVFVISGQSNAQGVPGYGGTRAKDDRVNCTDFLNENYDKFPNTSLIFSQLNDNSNIGPIGKTPWCWGQVGDSLAQKLGVPIMFFNAALTRTLSSNWYQSSVGLPTKDAIFQGYFVEGFPYQYLKTTLNYYSSLFGIRAVLWHQGETDTSPGVPVEDEIFGYYKGLIENTRKDFGQNMGWMFSRVSYSGGKTSDIVLKAHDRIIALPNFNIFEGPTTDHLMIPRFDGVHFGNTAEVKGLEILAKAWIEKLSNNFFSNCKPILTKPTVDLKIICSENTLAKISLPAGYTLFQWHDKSTDTTKFGKTGLFSANLIDAKGNYKIGNPINLNAVSFTAPSVITDGDFFCDGSNLLLKSDTRFSNIKWNTSATMDSILVNTAGVYSYSGTNSLGCSYQSSSKTVLKINQPEYAKKVGLQIGSEIILENKEVGFCEGSNLTLKADGNFSSYVWSDGGKDQERTINGGVTLSYHGIYMPGCPSLESATLVISEYPAPSKPNIVASGLYELSIESYQDFDFYEWFVDGQRIEEVSPTVKVSKTGNYEALVIKRYSETAQCLSERSEPLNKVYSNSAESTAYPNPAIAFLFIETPVTQHNVRVWLYNNLGKLVSEIPFLPIWDTKLEIPINNLPSGIYSLILESDETLLRKNISIL